MTLLEPENPSSNRNLTGEADRVFEYQHENHFTNVYVSETWRGEFKNNAL